MRCGANHRCKFGTLQIGISVWSLLFHHSLKLLEETFTLFVGEACCLVSFEFLGLGCIGGLLPFASQCCILCRHNTAEIQVLITEIRCKSAGKKQ